MPGRGRCIEILKCFILWNYYPCKIMTEAKGLKNLFCYYYIKNARQSSCSIVGTNCSAIICHHVLIAITACSKRQKVLLSDCHTKKAEFLKDVELLSLNCFPWIVVMPLIISSYLLYVTYNCLFRTAIGVHLSYLAFMSCDIKRLC
jgi:hypothetical protein